ncbi:MAG: SAM-dependent methyltransferase, partial [Anaerolineae bacterium]
MSHWRKQQRKETYFKKAKQEGYRARSAYKLLQIQEKFHIIRRGNIVVDLGAAPGSWSQVTTKLVGDKGRVIALDLQEIEPIPGVTILQGDMTDPEVQAQVIELAGG